MFCTNCKTKLWIRSASSSSPYSSIMVHGSQIPASIHVTHAIFFSSLSDRWRHAAMVQTHSDVTGGEWWCFVCLLLYLRCRLPRRPLQGQPRLRRASYLLASLLRCSRSASSVAVADELAGDRTPRPELMPPSVSTAMAVAGLSSALSLVAQFQCSFCCAWLCSLICLPSSDISILPAFLLTTERSNS